MGGDLRITGGWPGEPYVADDPTSLQAPASRVIVDINTIDGDVRWLWVVTW